MDNNLLYNSFDPKIPKPVAFYGWKHHLGFISKSISELRGSITNEEVKYLCQNIRGSVIDLYTGGLTCFEIAREIKLFIEKNKIIDLNSFTHWFNKNDDFRLVSISDGSSWTLRKARFVDRYIHIHPSRYSSNSIRIKSTTLRTAIAYCLLFDSSIENPAISDLNLVRVNLLNLSPLKEDVLYHPIFRVVKFLHR